MLDLKTAIARFDAEAKAKLSNPSATGEPEDQLRAPLEALFADIAEPHHGPFERLRLADGLDQVDKILGKTNSLIGAALRLLSDEAGSDATLKTSLGTLTASGSRSPAAVTIPVAKAPIILP